VMTADCPTAWTEEYREKSTMAPVRSLSTENRIAEYLIPLLYNVST
jgi:hypothetical protein